MKSTEYVLLTKILTDVGIMCNTSMDRDRNKILTRIKAEGLSFLTITLPSFAKGFERCLEQGSIDPTLFPAFSKTRDSKRLIPRFLSGITSMVFDHRDGILRKDASIEAIDGVRQICLTFNKLKKECTDARKQKAIKAYLQCEEDLQSLELSTWAHRKDYDTVCRTVFGRVFNDLQGNLLGPGLVPKHGPGAVVEKLSGNAKYRQRYWTERLSDAMPPDNYLFSNSEAWIDGSKYLKILSQAEEKPVKVIFVPKTQKTPRVIAIEPTHMQYAQQAIMLELVPRIERDPILGKSIHFTDSSFNRSLARKSSKDRKYATLDMSEASDRVHVALVVDMMRSYPHLLQAVMACRTTSAKLPNGRVIERLWKFASMGSALCFPIESMVFYVLCVLAGLRVRGLRVSAPNINLVSRNITVFGDDLIVPTAWREMCTNMLESVGLRVNQSKSFSSGFFRESCGVDAYKGHLVTPVYVRQSMPKTRHDTEELLSAVATSNLFYQKGYWETADFMRIYIESIFGSLPHVGNNSPVVGWTSFQEYYSVERWNKILSRFEIHGLITKVRTKVDVLEGYDRLFKFHLLKAQQAIAKSLGKVSIYGADSIVTGQPLEVATFEKSTLRGSVYTKRRWTTPY